MKLTRRHRFDGSDLPAYRHPNEWLIKKEKRDWSLRGFPRGAVGTSGRDNPLFFYTIFHAGHHTQYPIHTEARLRDAREWCDTHKRVYRQGGYVVVDVDTEPS